MGVHLFRHFDLPSYIVQNEFPDSCCEDSEQHGKYLTAWIGVEDRGRYKKRTDILQDRVGSHDLIGKAKLCHSKEINGGRNTWRRVFYPILNLSTKTNSCFSFLLMNFSNSFSGFITNAHHQDITDFILQVVLNLNGHIIGVEKQQTSIRDPNSTNPLNYPTIGLTLDLHDFYQDKKFKKTYILVHSRLTTTISNLDSMIVSRTWYEASFITLHYISQTI